MRKKLLLIGSIVLLPYGCAHTTKNGFHTSVSGGAAHKPPKEYVFHNGTYKVGKSYRIKGKTYKPKIDYKYDQVGMASWYGHEFHGKKTANGEIYDMNVISAAHKTLPIPSIVRVTTLANNRSLLVRVSDRGPYCKDRIIDLSKRGAQILDFEHKGITKVRVQVLEKESRMLAQGVDRVVIHDHHDKMSAQPLLTEAKADLQPSSKPAPTVITVENMENDTAVAKANKGIYIQAASFSSEKTASSFKDRISHFGPAEISPVTLDNKVFHRVRLGPLNDMPAADELVSKLGENGHMGARIIVQ